MKITTAFPSDYLKAADLQGRDVTATMDRVEMREFGGDCKPALFFEGKQRFLILNKTNSATIADAYGDETDNWAGKQIILFPTTTDYQGRRVDAIRVRVPTRQQAPAVERPTPPPAESYGQGMDDEIPF